MTAITYAGPRRVLAIRWGRDRAPVAAPTQASRPAIVGDVPMTTTERATKAAQARAEQLDPERRREIAQAASKAAGSPVVRVQQLVRAWEKLSDEERTEQRPVIRRALRDAGIIA